MATRLFMSGPLAATGVAWRGYVNDTSAVEVYIWNNSGNTIVFEESDDDSTYTSIATFFDITKGVFAYATGGVTSRGKFSVPVTKKYFRARVSVYSAGTVELDVHRTDSPFPLVNSRSAILNVLDFGAVGDGQTDNLAAFNAASMAATQRGGAKIEVPYSPQAYILSDYVNVRSGVQFVGVGLPTLKMTVKSRVFRIDNANDILIEGFIIDGNGANVASGNIITVNAANRVRIARNQFINAKASLAITGASADNEISDNTFTNGLGTAIELNGSAVTRNKVLRNRIHNGVGFGVWVVNASNNNLIEGNLTILNGLELVGITWDCYANRVIGNHAEGCGDNGISVTGYLNTIQGNISKKNTYDGIYLYGKMNTCVGNTVLNNSQTGAGQRSGITVGGQSGGIGQLNVINGNIIDDDQASPTQQYGVKLNGPLYTAWAQGQAVTVGTYRRNGTELYIAASAATTGATAPVHTSGTVSDGAVNWTWVDSFQLTTTESAGNIVANNMINRAQTGKYLDSTTNRRNSIYQPNIGFGGMLSGTGTPEAAVTARVGTLYLNESGGAGTSIYVKSSGTGNTGWTAL